MKTYQKIDLFRLYCACWVVLIHCVEVREGHPVASMLVDCFSRQAVPFFFIASGFFLGKKLYQTKDQMGIVRKFVTHNLLLYGAWMILELPSVLSVYRTMYPDAGIVYFAALVVRRICLAGQGVYWYVLVLAEAGLVCGVLLTKKKEKLLYGLAVAGLVLRMIYSYDISVFGLETLNRLFYIVFSWSNNVVMFGVPFMTVGMVFARYEGRFLLPQKKLILAYGLTGIAAVGFFTYAYYANSGLLRYLTVGGLQGTLLFLIAMHPLKRSVSPALCKNCRDISTCVYYLHTVFIYNVANRFWPVDSPIPLRYAVAIVPPIVICFLVRKLNWKPLKWMLSMK